MTQLTNIDERAMTPIRRDALAIVENLPEERLAMVLGFLLEMAEQAQQGDMLSRRQAFERLEGMIKPLPNLDYEKELNDWREERFVNANFG